MKRFAILLGHADGQLSTNKDLFRMEKFLKSDRGGAWYTSEIHSEINISLRDLLKVEKQENVFKECFSLNLKSSPELSNFAV